MEQALSRQSNNDEHHSHDHHGHGHENHRSLKILGFWIFLVSDLILFASLFATYLVLRTHTNGAPDGKELFEVPIFVAETFLLLTSSFTSGLATLYLRTDQKNRVIGWLIVTILLGIGFISLEVTEFVRFVQEGATISSSAFLSAFFALVGTHGLHVSVGIVWMTGLTIQLARYGINEVTSQKLHIAGLYWHFLDVVWIFIFTVVYLMGVV